MFPPIVLDNSARTLKCAWDKERKTQRDMPEPKFRNLTVLELCDAMIARREFLSKSSRNPTRIYSVGLNQVNTNTGYSGYIDWFHDNYIQLDGSSIGVEVRDE